ncbi:mercury resistance system periplasmic binding protein MerP [Pollutimonas sp. H1-120]|uniref:mercury resistance system periplasmic binding protein MerP n=1 Tax=Pollutimonas sp. H1-120 TaxID=3148824 RepID=UPI003B51A429
MKKLFAAAALCALAAPVWAASTTVTLSVPTMDCPICPLTMKKALTKVPGVNQVEVNFDKRLAIVTYEDSKTNVGALVKATTDAGYPSTLAGSTK